MFGRLLKPNSIAGFYFVQFERFAWRHVLPEKPEQRYAAIQKKPLTCIRMLKKLNLAMDWTTSANRFTYGAAQSFLLKIKHFFKKIRPVFTG